MQAKILLRQKILAIIFTGFAFFLVFILKDKIGNNSIPLTANTTLLYEQEKVNLPVRLKIPKIKVDAAVEYVGVTEGGAMDVPKDAASVGWFDPGTRPGENGSAVMAGHYGSKVGKPAAFDNLHKLHPGDKVYVEDEKGIITTFVVRETRNYDKDADASEVFISTDGMAHLNLITCEGVWDKTVKSYSKRLVVFTDKEME